MDELPEFARPTLEALRQPLGKRLHCRFPGEFPYRFSARFSCGGHESLSLRQFRPSRAGMQPAPKCAEEYRARISGPLLDRIDIQIEVPAVSPWDLADVRPGESSDEIRKRVIAAREIQKKRFAAFGCPSLLTNSQLKGELLEQAAALDNEAKALLVVLCRPHRDVRPRLSPYFAAG